MNVKKPSYEVNNIVLYAATEDGFHIVKTEDGEYICTCNSTLDECEHIIEFKREEANGNIS